MASLSIIGRVRFYRSRRVSAVGRRAAHQQPAPQSIILGTTALLDAQTCSGKILPVLQAGLK